VTALETWSLIIDMAALVIAFISFAVPEL